MSEVFNLRQIAATTINRKTNVNCGYMYVKDGISYLLAYVCIGKCLIGTYADSYVFLRCELPNYVQTNVDAMTCIRNGLFTDVRVIVNVLAERVKKCGQVIEEDRVNLWLTQLKMAGKISNEVWWNKEIACCAYIGNWKKRTTLECVKSSDLTKGQWYIQEPMAFLFGEMRSFPENVSNLYLWYYAGEQQNYEVPIFVWYRVSVHCAGIAKVGVTEEVMESMRKQSGWDRQMKRHVVKNQYANMVAFDSNAWKLPEQYVYK